MPVWNYVWIHLHSFVGCVSSAFWIHPAHFPRNVPWDDFQWVFFLDILSWQNVNQKVHCSSVSSTRTLIGFWLLSWNPSSFIFVTYSKDIFPSTRNQTKGLWKKWVQIVTEMPCGLQVKLSDAKPWPSCLYWAHVDLIYMGRLFAATPVLGQKSNWSSFSLGMGLSYCSRLAFWFVLLIVLPIQTGTARVSSSLSTTHHVHHFHNKHGTVPIAINRMPFLTRGGHGKTSPSNILNLCVALLSIVLHWLSDKGQEKEEWSMSMLWLSNIFVSADLGILEVKRVYLFLYSGVYIVHH